MNANTKELRNGLKIVVVPHKVKTITACLRILCGSNIENKKEIGAAHMLEHLSMRAASKTERANKILFNGGRFTGTTSRDDVAFFAKIMKKDLPNALDFLRSCITLTDFSQTDLQKTKEEVCQEINMNIQDPMKYVYRLSYKNIFPNQRPAEFNTGDISHVKALSLDTLINFKTQYYDPSKAVVSICGDVSAKDIFNFAEDIFGNLEKKDTDNSVNLYPYEKSSVISAERKGIPLTYLKIDSIGYKASDKRKYPAFLLGFIIKARLKKLLNAYTLDAFSFSSNSYGIFSVAAAVSNKQDRIIFENIKKQQEDLMNNDMSAQELNYAKNKLLADFEFSMEKTSLRADYFSELFLYNQVTRDYKKDIENYMKCTDKDIKEIAKELFAQPVKVCVLSENASKMQFYGQGSKKF